MNSMNSKKTVRWIALIALLIAIVWLGNHWFEAADIKVVERWLQQSTWLAPILFIGIYSVATVLILPALPLTLLGGFLFGPILGTFLSLTGATLGASAAFLIARCIAEDWVRARLGPRLAPLMAGIAKEGWRFVAYVRLIPLLPFNLLNYALGLTPVRFVAYVVASYIFMAPAAMVYSYIGALGKTALAGEWLWIAREGFIGIGLILLLLAIPWVVKRVRRRE